MDQIAVTLPCDDGKYKYPRQYYPIHALRQSSSYFDAMLGGRWSETHDNEGEYNDGMVSRVVDLSASGLDPVACESILQFMVSRCSDARDRDAEERANCKLGIVSLEEIKELLWEGFQWDEDNTTVDWGSVLINVQHGEHQPSIQHDISSTINSDEVALYRAIDYIHLQPYDEILSKLWAMKIVHCPCFLEEALKNKDLIGSTNEGEGDEMYIKRIPGGRQLDEQLMWRVLVCMFICRMLVYGGDGNAGSGIYDHIDVVQVRARNYLRRLEEDEALNQLSYLCLGIGEKPVCLLKEMVSHGLMNIENHREGTEGCVAVYWQTSQDSQVKMLWNKMDSLYL